MQLSEIMMHFIWLPQRPLGRASALWVALSLFLTVAPAQAASSPKGAADKQREFIAVLQRDSAPADKAMACKQLAIYGTGEAVPALAPLLSDEHLASWARIALEAIPGPAPDRALRQALTRLRGNLLIGVINSIGVRRDANAVLELTGKLKDSDPGVVSAAAVALGRIGGTRAAGALRASLSHAPAPAIPAVAEGCSLCAERLLAQGDAKAATKLYDALREAKLPRHKVLEGTRGAILARQSAGLPLLLEQLRAPDKDRFNLGLRVARELPGRPVTDALIAELPKCPPERRAFLLLALAERNDPAAWPAVLAAARSGPEDVRLMAVHLLDRQGDALSVPVLFEVACSADTALAQAASAALARLPGESVDTDLLGRLPEATGKGRQALIEIMAQRRMDIALPDFARCAQDSDPGVRAAGVRALGSLGGQHEAGVLVALLAKTSGPSERADLEPALAAIAGRLGAACVPVVQSLAQAQDSALRALALRVMATAGGPSALEAVRAGLEDQDEAVRDEAARGLSTWPNNWPDDSNVGEPLLALARSDRKPEYRVLGLRGYLQWVQGDSHLPGPEKAAKVKAALPLLQTAETKRQAIAVLDSAPSATSVELLMGFAEDPTVAEDACVALEKLAAPTSELLLAQRRQALQTILDKSADTARKEKARKGLAASKE